MIPRSSIQSQDPIMEVMTSRGIFSKLRTHTKMAGGFFSFEEEGTSTKLYGFGHGDHIRLRDELGNVWRGSAERGDNDSVRYTFRDPNGRIITGVSESSGIILRDGRGKTWRGFID
jgi:hypothetical protein